MAARLAWDGPRLKAGRWVLAYVETMPKHSRYVVRTTGLGEASDMYESITDCMTDCESEVRRLLKEAGCEVEP